MLSRALIMYALIGGLFNFPGICLAQDNRIDTIRSDAPELAPYGKLAVGVKTVKLSNPQQLDVAKFKAGAPMPVYDRPLTVEVWYPAQLAAGQSAGGTLRAITRDGKTEVTLNGRAVRDAQLLHGRRRALRRLRGAVRRGLLRVDPVRSLR
jgi:hypothetical protein